MNQSTRGGSNLSRPALLVTIAGGGFLWQSQAVAGALAGDFDLHYVSGEPREAFPNAALPPGQWHRVAATTTFAHSRPWLKAKNVLAGLWSAMRLMRSVRPAAVICVATSQAIPLFACARVLGIGTVFVESITRVSSPSATGLILSRLRLCDRLYVQWPEAVRLYRGALYRGSVL
jgi:UDP-N-acetylglucosamine:LPS N-acetylglucosamine transferase